MSVLKRFDTSKYSIFLILLGVFAIASFLSPNFLSGANLTNILRQVAVITILAYGAMSLIIAGMIDLSAASVMAFSGVVSVIVYKDTGSLAFAILAGVAVGVICNVINAVMVASFNTPAFIVTLGMMMMARGAVLELTQGQNVLQLGDFTKIGQSDLFGIPLPAIYLVVVTAVISYLMTQTRYGRGLYAVGGNEFAARASGINIVKVKYQAFIVNGALVGLAGVIFMSRVNAGLPNAGVGYELHAITAPLIGGTSFSGGVGSTAGTLAGALIVGLLGNIMNLTGVGSYIQQIVMGLIIALAVMYDVRSKRNKRPNTILGARKKGGRGSGVSGPVTGAPQPVALGRNTSQ